MVKDAIILLSGGLDSALNLVLAKESIALALTIDYGQRAVNNEIKAAQELTEYYRIKHKILKINFFNGLQGGALLGETEVPVLTDDQLANDTILQEETAKKVWVPNRNGLFINIAASLAEGMGLNKIIVGFNAEEAQTFPDNSQQFIDAINFSLSFSTQNSVKVSSKTTHLTKKEMMELAIAEKIPLTKLWSCYHSGVKQCQECESCMRFQRAYRLVMGVDYVY